MKQQTLARNSHYLNTQEDQAPVDPIEPGRGLDTFISDKSIRNYTTYVLTPPNLKDALKNSTKNYFRKSQQHA